MQCCSLAYGLPANSNGRGRSRLEPGAGEKGGSETGPSPVDRGRPGSKHDLLVDGRGIPLAFCVTGGNRNDVTQLIPLLDGVPAVRGAIGRPRRRPERLIADRSDDHDKYRRPLWQRGVKPVIARRQTDHGSGLGRDRWVVERIFAWLHKFKRLLIRYERRADMHHTSGPAEIDIDSRSSPVPGLSSARLAGSVLASVLRLGSPDLRAYAGHVGDRLECPRGGLDAGPLGREPREVALEAGRCAEEEIAGVGIALVGEGMGDSARGEDDLTSRGARQRLLELEGELAAEHVEGLVELMGMQGRPAPLPGDRVLDHRDLAAGLLASQEDAAFEVSWHELSHSFSLFGPRRV
jgi:transposase